MKIKILGTAAAEGWPALFCNCKACNIARELGGKNIRTRASILIDDLLKIDLPPDTLMHSHNYNLELHKLKYLLITHSHADHLNADDLELIIEPFAYPGIIDRLKIYSNRTSNKIIKKSMKRHGTNFNKNKDLLNKLSAFQELSIPPYNVTTLKANHSPKEEALNYIIEKQGKSLLYTCDTGYYQKHTWDFLKGKKVDMVISECTMGCGKSDYKYHMGMLDVVNFKQKSEEIGLTDINTKWILTHFSHGGAKTHKELEELACPHGFIIAWDGMEI
ncbi:MAG: MBL fold metallo-hydrolase [Spirochaetaceae bacterium]